MSRSKFNNRKVKADGHTFDSDAEYRRYCQLRLLERAGEIADLRLQFPVELMPPVRVKPAIRAITYIPDFVYIEGGVTVIEDVKGVETDVFSLKWNMLRRLEASGEIARRFGTPVRLSILKVRDV